MGKKHKSPQPTTPPDFRPMSDDRIQQSVNAFSERRRAAAAAARQKQITELAMQQIARERAQAARAQAEAAQRQRQANLSKPANRPATNAPQQPETSRPTVDITGRDHKSKLHIHLGKKAVAGIVSLLLVGGGVGGYYFTHATSNGSPEASGANNLGTTQGQVDNSLDSSAFSADTCMEPSAAVMIANFKEIDYPLVPIITTSKQHTPGPAAKIFTGQTPSGLSPNLQSAFSQDATTSVDGYAAATAKDLPEDVSVCVNGDGAIAQSSSAATVNMSEINVVFSDPSQIFHNVNLVQARYTKAGGTENIQLDPNKGEYLEYPDPAYWLMQTNDKVQAASAAAVSKEMFTQSQMQALLATVENSAYSQLINPTYNGGGITLPDGADTLRRAVQNAIARRLKLNWGQITWVAGSNKNDFNYILAGPKTGASKQPLTAINPKTGMSALAGLDPTQKAKFTVDIVDGAMVSPTIASPPPTPTASPTPTSTKKP